MLRYNTGRPIYRNGEDLTELLETLVAHWPVPVERIILIGHSMGGLLIRSACHHGQRQCHRWTELLSDCVYIGSPHDGSWLARGAKATAELMNQAPRDYLRVVGEVIDLRSEGIRNLSRGEVVNDGDGEPPCCRAHGILWSAACWRGPDSTRLMPCSVMPWCMNPVPVAVNAGAGRLVALPHSPA